MFEHVFLVGVLIALVAACLRARSLKQENIRLTNSLGEARQESTRLSNITAPLQALSGELLSMLARARAEKLVDEVVIRDAKAIVEGRLTERSPELLTLRQRLEKQFLTAGKLGPVARAEVQRIERELLDAKTNGWPAVLIGEFEYGKHEQLGSISEDGDHYYPLPANLRSWTYVGPIQQIVDYLREQGLHISVQSELRYVNHPRGGGLAYQVLVRVP